MRMKFVGVLLGLGLLAGSVAPALACAFHDQQANAAAQQQTADAQGTNAATQ